MGGRRALSEVSCWRLLAEADVIDVAGPGPILRSLNHVVHGGAVWVHGGRTGEKSALVGAEVVGQVREVVARIPSWMRDPERACPATTWYRSVQVRGTLVEEVRPDRKAAALQALMEARQSEGRYLPIRADHALYAKAVRATRVLRLEVAHLAGVERLGQHLTTAAMASVLRGLWERGAPGDLAAIEQVSAAHPARPVLTELPDGLRLRVHPSVRDAERAAALVADAYWNRPFCVAVLRDAVLGSDAWVGLEAPDGTLVATARAVSDRTKRSWIYDVMVEASWRGRGLGSRLLSQLLDHPAVRDTHVMLGTRDAMSFYAQLGFETALHHPGPPYPRTWMARRPGLTPARTRTRPRCR